MDTPTRNTPGIAARPDRIVGPVAVAFQQRVGGFRRLPVLLRGLGLDPDAMLARAGLLPDALDAAEARVSYHQVAQLLHAAAVDARCPHLGLLAGRLWHLDDLGVLGDLMRHSETLREALRTLAVFQHLNSESGLAFLAERAASVEFGYATYLAEGPGIDLVHDAAIAVGANILHELTGGELLPSGVALARGRPADTTPWRRTFHVLPRFDAEYSALTFPSRELDRPIAGADRVRWARAWREAERAGPGDPVQQAARALRRLFLEGRFSGDAVADQLALHRRTLNRRLRVAGTTFRDVLDDVRSSVARELLADTAIGLDDIAASLGYAGVSPFMRAFRRWTGETPGQWRHRARESA